MVPALSEILPKLRWELSRCYYSFETKAPLFGRYLIRDISAALKLPSRLFGVNSATLEFDRDDPLTAVPIDPAKENEVAMRDVWVCGACGLP